MKKLFTLISVLCLLTLTGCAKSNEQTVSATAKGYGGDITVTLTVKDDKITDVKIVGDGETKDVGSKAVEQMPEQILSAQTYDVDGVSGATISSTSIKKATKEAMTAAGLLATEEGSSACGIDGSLDLDAINEFLNTSADMGEGSIANAVAIIPINHINGPRDEHDFYAFVNFKYKARNYIKYQITYLSCTCRSADVNYWMTAYVELTLPDSGNIEDSKIRTLSFDYDAEGHYLAGFWGDSNPTPAGNTYEEFKEQYIPFFVGKDYAYIKTLDVVEDIDPALYAEGEGRENLTLDTFTGSSVSTNNIIRMLNALYEYHATDSYFNK
ncbi:MAG: FMN-binding protein [Solobacterium sp.]|nr:FMN-binding protein [Solobacterium sp.]MDD5982326.1 FMN-binding protein [Solobacterium sp.]MDD6833817.1 FMN-binding protein [Solobacterium sp.]MDD6885410.1 FMN-binding protein [Solobacterium sp.]